MFLRVNLQPVSHAKNRLDIMALRFSLTHFFIDKQLPKLVVTDR